MLEQNISVIQMHLLSVQIQWMTFLRILMITTQTDKKIFIVFDDTIADIMSNKHFKSYLKNCLLDAEN